MEGVIQGGWEYVQAAYAVVLGGVVLYGIGVLLRRRHAEKEAAAAAAPRP